MWSIGLKKLWLKKSDFIFIEDIEDFQMIFATYADE